MASQSCKPTSRAPMDGGRGRHRSHEIIAQGTIRGAYHPAPRSCAPAAVPKETRECESSHTVDFASAGAIALPSSKTLSKDGNSTAQSSRFQAFMAEAGRHCARSANLWTHVSLLTPWPAIIPNKPVRAGFLPIFISGTLDPSRSLLRCSVVTHPPGQKTHFSSR